MKHIKHIKKIPYVLVIIGALNWGIYGLSGFDIVDVLVGDIPMIARIIYVGIGLSALYSILNRCALCRCKGCSCTVSIKTQDAHTCCIEDKK